ncbi:exocyst complex component Sec10-like protein [Pyronema domesticum]|uniref:Similar to Exocyst complex component sec10 acc. no. O13705 n=1 Tax=Pyronema omphalodes (strain CBS 100304) TaxID=1076935 RepID=U4LT55_PYROM|nr:exocyst complex component Sec10-like protein [Pyronema domesticum]CCX34869.1 Similar to Exocyst complex component sec10; acc. no. O13705 [Pyronema omphalodes CBS 100304]
MVSATEAARPIFPKANSFSLEEFSSKDFIVKDFIEGLTDSSIPANRRSGLNNNGSAFDPKPYIRTFEAALDRLKELDETLSEKESELKEGVRRAEIEHSRTLDRLGDKFNSTLQEFHRLDNSITDGGGMAVRIGGQLEALDKQRQRAEDAKFLIACYTEFSRGETRRLEKLRRTGRIEDSIRCAVVSRQLSLIVKRNEGAAANVKTKELIESFSESLEQDLLKQFDDAYRRFKKDQMKGCAKVLHDFNGGASVVSNFLNQMNFFIETGKINAGDVVIEKTIEERLSDPDDTPPGLEPSLVSLISEVREVLKVESETIKDVFPFPEQVLGTLLQRVFQQSLQQRLEMVLDKTATLSPLAFLRTLQASRAAVITLADDLKNHGLTEHPGPLSSATTMVIDQNVEELFIPYLQDRGYMERERESLEQLYSGILLKFSLFHDQRKKNQNLGVLDRLKKSRERVIEKVIESDLGKSQSGALSRIIGFNQGANGSGHLSDVIVTDQDGKLNVEFSKRMLKWLAEAVGRSIELSSAADTPKDVSALLNILLEHMRNTYIDVALDAAMDSAEQASKDTKSEPDLAYVQEMKPATKIMHLMFSFINTALIPLSQTSLTTRREMVKVTNTTITSLEQKINTIIQKTADIVINYLGILLSKQKKQDYKPKDDEVILTILQTPTCVSVCAFLTKVHTVALESLDGENLLGFLNEIGQGLRGFLLEHLKKFPVNQAGAIMLSKDVTKYREVVDKFNVAALKDSYELLHEIGNLFVVGPQALKDRMRDGVLARVKPSILKPYLMKREDYVSVGIEKILLSE